MQKEGEPMKMKKRFRQSMRSPSIVPGEPPTLGFEEFRTILSDWVVVRFSVPCHAWNELVESKEWRDFQNLLEKYQKEYIRTQHTVVGCQREN